MLPRRQKIFLGNGDQRWSSVLNDRACKEDEKPESPDPCFDCILQYPLVLVSFLDTRQ